MNSEPSLAPTPSPALEPIAIVGYSGRFPAAVNLEEFWLNLVRGQDSLELLDDEELDNHEPNRNLSDSDGVDGNRGQQSPAHFVNRCRPLDGVEFFDAALFGYSPREASLLDPQQRVFLESAWTALEDAGHAPEQFDGSIGVFAGGAIPTYLPTYLAPDGAARRALDDLVVQLGNEKDFLAPRVAYHLDLRGPAITVQTGCSSSLVAIIQAAQSLRSHECDMVLAGGVALRFPMRRGYAFDPDGILSSDGRCRPYDADASGTSFGNGCGVVVMRRLADAIEDGDDVRAVVLGAAINNDGACKSGFTAPSVDQQAEVIATAHALSGVSASEIDYVEGHGTGTALGDAVEVAALTRAFESDAAGETSCRLGSVKGNVGHLEAAAGVAGVIKTVLALQHEELPPTAHFRVGNPECQWEHSPFRVTSVREPWPRGQRTRRAGVSSFGVGGTNAHLVVEEAPLRPPSAATSEPQLVVLSARDEPALERVTAALAAHLRRNPELSFADVAFTLQVGRRRQDCRRAFVADDLSDAIAQLESRRRHDDEIRAAATEALAASEGTGEVRSTGNRRASLQELGRLWIAGADIDWREHHRDDERRRRLRLPTYPFERTRCWSDASAANAGLGPSAARDRDPAAFTYARSWRRVPGLRLQAKTRQTNSPEARASDPHHVLALVDASTESLALALERSGRNVTIVHFGCSAEPAESCNGLRLESAQQSAADALLDNIGSDQLPDIVCNFLLATEAELEPRDAIERGLRVTQSLARALDSRGRGALQIVMPTQRLFDVVGDEIEPSRATILGACRVLPMEFPRLSVQCLDFDSALLSSDAECVAGWIEQSILASNEPILAIRGGHVFEPHFEPVELELPAPQQLYRERGVYLITGGFGGIGQALAWRLAESCHARLILCGRRGTAGNDDAVRALEAAGAEVLACAVDVGDRAGMQRVLGAARTRFGAIDGVVHAAGVAAPGLGAASPMEPAMGDAFTAKVEGTLLLAELVREADFIALCSATAVELGGLGQAEYCAANAFMDAFAERASVVREAPMPRVVSIGWDTWAEVGMAVDSNVHPALQVRKRDVLRDGLRTSEGIEVFERALGAPHAHVLVSTRNWNRVLEAASVARSAYSDTVEFDDERAAGAAGEGASATPPERMTAHQAEVHEAWVQLLGLDGASLDESFFDQGGNSLLAAQLLGRFDSLYPAAGLNLRRFFDAPTIRGIADRIEASLGETSTPTSSRADAVRNATDGDSRLHALADYLREEVAAATGHSMNASDSLLEFDRTMLAAHLTAALQRDLELAIYPHELRGQATLPELVHDVLHEMQRLSSFVSDGDASQRDVPLEAARKASNQNALLANGTKLEPAAFLLSSPRSGSTLTRLMLSANRGLFCPPELFLLKHDSMGAWDQDAFADFYRDGVVRALMQRESIDYEVAAKRVREWVARDAPIAEVYRALQGKERSLVDKTPMYADDEQALARAEELFKEPKYIILVRHPSATIESIVRNRLDRVRGYEGDSRSLAEQHWIKVYENMLRLEERVGTARALRVRFEDLLADPQAELRRMCKFLGVDFNAEMLDPYTHGQMAGGPGDPHLFKRGAIDPSRADAWKSAESRPRPGAECRRIAAIFGYEVEA